MLSLLMDAKDPRPIGPNYADSLSGMFACIGVLGAIAARAKTGKGQQVRHDDGRFDSGFLDCAGDGFIGNRQDSRAIHASDAVADLCL